MEKYPKNQRTTDESNWKDFSGTGSTGGADWTDEFLNVGQTSQSKTEKDDDIADFEPEITASHTGTNDIASIGVRSIGNMGKEMMLPDPMNGTLIEFAFGALEDDMG